MTANDVGFPLNSISIAATIADKNAITPFDGQLIYYAALPTSDFAAGAAVAKGVVLT